MYVYIYIYAYIYTYMYMYIYIYICMPLGVADCLQRKYDVKLIHVVICLLCLRARRTFPPRGSTTGMMSCRYISCYIQCFDFLAASGKDTYHVKRANRDITDEFHPLNPIGMCPMSCRGNVNNITS